MDLASVFFGLKETLSILVSSLQLAVEAPAFNAAVSMTFLHMPQFPQTLISSDFWANIEVENNKANRNIENDILVFILNDF
jgi:hypothetical protein